MNLFKNELNEDIEDNHERQALWIEDQNTELKTSTVTKS